MSFISARFLMRFQILKERPHLEKVSLILTVCCNFFSLIQNSD